MLRRDVFVTFKNRFLTGAAIAAAVTVLVQVLAFLRQLLIAAYFGIGRDFDAYVLVFTVATMIVFAFSGIIDSIAVPHLVRTQQNDGPDAAQAFARSIFRLSIWLSGGLSLLFLIATPLLGPILAAGFSSQERAGLGRLAWYFLPWTLVAVPYYAAAARYKMEWRFNRIFAAEILVVVASTGFLLVRHGDISLLPLAYAFGYGVGLVHLSFDASLWCRRRTGKVPSAGGILRNVGEMLLANQTGGLSALVDRHIQSFLVPGGIGAVNYSSQLITAASSLLTFREIYMVPLSAEANRSEKLERLVGGLVLLAVPLAGFVACFAPEILTVLLQRGRFDSAATELTAQALRISAFGLVTSTIYLPLLRMFQILDRIRATYVLYLLVSLEYALFGYLFVVVLGLGVSGVALMQLTASGLSLSVAVFLLGRYGIRLSWRPMGGYFLLAALAAGIGSVAAIVSTTALEIPWLRLMAGGIAYGTVVLLCYLPARARLRDIAFGMDPERSVTASRPTGGERYDT